MLYINPQWQGSGQTDELRIGADTLGIFFKDYEKITVPLSNKGLEEIDGIKCLAPILEQTASFKNILLKSKPTKLATIGGDCGIEVIPISYLNKVYKGNLYVIWIDAHADLNTPESSPSNTFHGMPLRALLGEGNNRIWQLLFSTLEPEQICLVGLRDSDEPETEYIKKNQLKLIEQCDFLSIKNHAKPFRNVYIHLDLDVLDASEFAHTMFPTSNGFTIDDVHKLILDIKREFEVVGMCITESKATKIEQLEPIRKILEEIHL